MNLTFYQRSGLKFQFKLEEDRMKNNSIIKNIMYAFGAQGLSMILSILMAMFLPKVLGVTDYSYWQLFIFYTSYAGFFHLGLNDGVYLKLGGKNYEDLDYSLLKSNLLIATVFQSIVCFCIALYTYLFTDIAPERQFVLWCTAICIVLTNFSGFLSYILQLSNRIKEYSFGVVINRASFMVVVIIGILSSVSHFSIYIVCYLIAQLLSTIYQTIKCWNVIKARPVGLKPGLQDAFDNLRIGINLMVSSIASMLILGIGRSMIDAKWGIEAFGKFSLALSLSNFLLQFISQVSLVLFPAFRRLDQDRIKEYYILLRTALSTVLAGILIFYMPLYYLFSSWLPQYSESLRYMVILLPICTFDGKMNMLCNTYLKVLRKERILLKINLISLSISIVLCALGTYVIDNIFAVTIAMVISVAARSIIAERYLSGLFKEKIIHNIIMEIILSLIFVCSSWFLGALTGFVIYIVFYIIYLFIKREELSVLFKWIKARKGNAV